MRSDELRRVIAITKALSDETRLRALMLLRDGELCLCQIIDVLELAPSTVSKHMSVLADAGLVERRKEGRWHYYRMAEKVDAFTEPLLTWTRKHLTKDNLMAADRRRLTQAKPLTELTQCYRS